MLYIKRRISVFVTRSGYWHPEKLNGQWQTITKLYMHKKRIKAAYTKKLSIDKQTNSKKKPTNTTETNGQITGSTIIVRTPVIKYERTSWIILFNHRLSHEEWGGIYKISKTTISTRKRIYWCLSTNCHYNLTPLMRSSNQGRVIAIVRKQSIDYLYDKLAAPL